MRMVRGSRIVKDAGRIAENTIAPLQSTWRGLPSPSEARFEELPVGRLMAPDGDRRHRTQSSCVINEVPILERHQDIVRVLVLREDRLDDNRRSLVPSPVEGPIQGRMRGDHGRKMLERSPVEPRVIDEGDVTHSADSIGRLTDRA